MQSLASDEYTAAVGDNGRFILKHSVTSKPADVEIDVPLNYADYYYLEALKRRRDIEKETLNSVSIRSLYGVPASGWAHHIYI